MSEKKSAIGFGFIPEESKHHFLVIVPKLKDSNVMVYERFRWEYDKNVQTINESIDKPKAKISKHKWKLIEETLKKEFNNRLKKQNTIVGRWKIGQIPVENLLGKEMVLLIWAIEDSDPTVIPVAIRNWLGLVPEERWWLFTMTNGATGGLYDRRGWRKAIRYALTENPVEDKKQQEDLFQLLFNKKNK